MRNVAAYGPQHLPVAGPNLRPPDPRPPINMVRQVFVQYPPPQLCFYRLTVQLILRAGPTPSAACIPQKHNELISVLLPTLFSRLYKQCSDIHIHSLLSAGTWGWSCGCSTSPSSPTSRGRRSLACCPSSSATGIWPAAPDIQNLPAPQLRPSSTAVVCRDWTVWVEKSYAPCHGSCVHRSHKQRPPI
jgi:hypothetical protein